MSAYADPDTIIVGLEKKNKELRRALQWSLRWFSASARQSERYRHLYEAAVRLTGQPDPQEWRDKQ